MKDIITLAILLAAGISLAATAQVPPQYQKYQNMTPEQMKAMQRNITANAQDMHNCFAKAGGMETMNNLKEKTDAAMVKIKKLCAGGKRDEAEQYAVAFGMEINKNDDMKAIRECGKQVEGMMKTLPANLLHYSKPEDSKTSHICDDN